MGRTAVAAGVFGSLVAASAVLGLMVACTAAPERIDGARITAGPTDAPRPGDVAPAASPVAVPHIPRRSAALDEQPASPAPPARLEVAALGIDVVVRPAGLDAQGRMALFDDPAVAAWYRWGPAPGSAAGSTVIAAHVDSLTYDLLPFARLRDAAPGTEVVVTDAAGARRAYAVESLEVIEKAEVDWNVAFDRAGPPRLTLVTCGGEFDTENRRYLSNLVVTATPID